MNKIVFKAETEENLAWEDSIRDAFREFFDAKEAQSNKIKGKVKKAEADGEPWPESEPQIGDGKQNAYETSNGIKIWWEVKNG